MESDTDDLITEMCGSVLTVTLNRPKSLNALTLSMRNGLRDAGDRAHLPDVKCILISARGRGFCAGVDLEESAFEEWRPRSDLRESFIPAALALAASSKPIVTAVQGVAAGAGLSLALSGDIVLASSDAKFLPVFTGLGIVPDAGLSHFLIRRMSYSRAFELLVDNKGVTAEHAVEWGLANKVLPAEGFADAALDYAQSIAVLPGIGAESTKKVLVAALRNSLVEQLEVEAQVQLWATKDEGGVAFRHAKFRDILKKN
jgi:2-(1,2-epoxy-1,2-dihydrophenyl)acetyl-CoA isomerase